MVCFESESDSTGGDGETDLVTRLSHSVPSRVKAFDVKIRLDGVSWEESFVWRCVSVKKRSGQGSPVRVRWASLRVRWESEVGEQPGSAGKPGRPLASA